MTFRNIAHIVQIGLSTFMLKPYQTLKTFSSKTFIQQCQAQSSVNAGDPGDGGAENFVWTKIFWIPRSRLLNKS